MKKILITTMLILSLTSCFKEKEISQSLLIEKYNQETFTLDLSNNNISEIPNLADFLIGTTIQEIKYINLSGNKLKDVSSSSFEKLTSLEKIDLSNNNITWLNLQKVNSKKIDLSNNKIEKVFISGTGIVEINLSNNLLTFGNDLKLPPSLITLNLEKNNLVNLDGFNKLKLIEYLNLNSNKLENKNLQKIKNNKNLKYIYVLNNKFSEKDLKRIEKFNNENK